MGKDLWMKMLKKAYLKKRTQCEKNLLRLVGITKMKMRKCKTRMMSVMDGLMKSAH